MFTCPCWGSSSGPQSKKKNTVEIILSLYCEPSNDKYTATCAFCLYKLYSSMTIVISLSSIGKAIIIYHFPWNILNISWKTSRPKGNACSLESNMPRRSNMVFSAIKAGNSKVNSPLWPNCECLWDFMPAQVICKFHKDQIKNERTMPWTMSSKAFFTIKSK